MENTDGKHMCSKSATITVSLNVPVYQRFPVFGPLPSWMYTQSAGHMRGWGRVQNCAGRTVIGLRRWQSPHEAKHTRPVSPGWGEDGSFNKSEQGNEVVRQASPARLSPQLGRRQVARRTAPRRDIFRVERLGNEACPPVWLRLHIFISQADKRLPVIWDNVSKSPFGGKGSDTKSRPLASPAS